MKLILLTLIFLQYVSYINGMNCYDSSPLKQNCASWKSLNYCHRGSHWYAYMSRYCKKTCHLCRDVVPRTTTTTTKPCQNTPYYNTNCKKWIRYCQRSTRYKPNQWYNFMRKHCKKTCGWCRKVKNLECGVDKKGPFGGIIDGTQASPSTWIWQASIYYFDEYLCGGSLISPQHILTAAHCVQYKDKEGMVIRLGDYKRDTQEKQEVEFKLESMTYHEQFDRKTLDNDIAIMKLKTPVRLTSDIGVVCLPETNEVVPVGTSCYITGWGRMVDGGTAANVLQEAKMPIVSNLQCGKRNVNKFGKSKITPNMICAGFKSDSKVSGCQGDSGGPLVCKSKENKWVLQGVVSWGDPNCDADKRYTVFARTSIYNRWIQNKL